MLREKIIQAAFKNKMMLFEKDQEYHLINDITIDEDLVVCRYIDRGE